MIDSVTDGNISPAQLKAKNPHLSVIYLLHATKTGNYKGDSQYNHLSDIELKVSYGQVEVRKSRFGDKGKYPIDLKKEV